MQIVMFAVNSADFVYLFFCFVVWLTIWNSICLPFCPLCGRVIGISSSSVFLMLRSFILYFYFYFHLFVLRASRCIGEVEQPRICFALSRLPPPPASSSPSFFCVHWQIVSHCELPSSSSPLLPRFPHYVTDRSRKLRLWLLPYWQQELMTKCLA